MPASSADGGVSGTMGGLLPAGVDGVTGEVEAEAECAPPCCLEEEEEEEEASASRRAISRSCSRVGAAVGVAVGREGWRWEGRRVGG